MIAEESHMDSAVKTTASGQAAPRQIHSCSIRHQARRCVQHRTPGALGGAREQTTAIPQDFAMKRLPSYDVQTGRAERNLYLTLGLAALALIGASAWNTTGFTDRPAGSFTAAPADLAGRIETKAESPSTNLTMYQHKANAEKSRLNTFGVPKS